MFEFFFRFFFFDSGFRNCRFLFLIRKSGENIALHLPFCVLAKLMSLSGSVFFLMGRLSYLLPAGRAEAEQPVEPFHDRALVVGVERVPLVPMNDTRQGHYRAQLRPSRSERTVRNGTKPDTFSRIANSQHGYPFARNMPY